MLEADVIIALNARFHETLYAPAHKDRTLATVANLRLNFERYLRFTLQETHHLDQSQKEHRQIPDLCIARDVEGACMLLRHMFWEPEICWPNDCNRIG